MAKYIFRIFFGVCLMLLSVGVLIYNAFLLTGGFDIALALLDLLLFVGGLLLTVFGAVAELERVYILQRQREGIAIAKANGVYKGRKPIQRAAFDAVVSQWLRGEMTAVEAQRRLELSPSTFYRKVRDYKKTEN